MRIIGTKLLFAATATLIATACGTQTQPNVQEVRFETICTFQDNIFPIYEPISLSMADDGRIAMADGDFVKTFKLPCEVDKIKCLDDGKFLMSVAAWDTSAHKDKEVLLVDENMEVLKSFIDYEESVDPNFTFSSQGFTETPDGILYHRPISDYVYLFSDKGRLLEKIHVDFGGKSVPDYVRKDVENNYDELSSYRMIVNAIHVDDKKVVGCLLEKGKYTDFIIDMTERTVFLRDKEHDSMHLVGISGGYAIFYVPAGQDASVGYMPDDVKTLYDKDNDVFFLMDLSRP